MYFFNDTKMLARFVRQVGSIADTPSIIQLIAGEAEYLMLCRAIVDDSHQHSQEIIKSIKTVCRKHGFDFLLLRERVTPAARALGLTLAGGTQLDYYKLLGTEPGADVSEIKRAFRKKAYELHPDTSPKTHADNEKFVELNTAYQTLSDPDLRRHYNLSRQNLNRWRETPRQFSITERMGMASFVLQLAALIILLIIGIFIFDFVIP